MIKNEQTALPRYIPGLLMFPDPSAGFIAGNVDIAFWATLLYPLSSVVYVLAAGFALDPSLFQPVGASNSTSTSVIDDYFITDDDNISATLSFQLNLVAALLLLIDSWICIWDWHIQRTFSTVSIVNATVQVNESQNDLILITELSDTDSVYYFLNNLFFFGSAIIYFMQALWILDVKTDLLHCTDSDWCGIFWVNFWGSMGYRKCIVSTFSTYKNIAYLDDDFSYLSLN